jgi:ubiquinone/menaquinone biosynthesis C-methylase UbiE
MTSSTAGPAATMAMTKLDWLVDCIRHNRFLPVPPAERQFVGDGDFRAVGAEFLHHFVALGALRPDDHVLDLGCGIGRMAVPLTQYLSDRATYLGIDVVEDGIRWSQEQISTMYPNFRFLRLDVRHPIYNPAGTSVATAVRLPAENASIDFAIVVSVFTHLLPPEMLAYAGEIARVLKPGGRCFCTAFIMNEASRGALRRAAGRLPFDPNAPGPVHFAFSDNPLAAVAHDEAWLFERLALQGLRIAGPARYGRWSGRDDGLSYQDLCILTPAAAGLTAADPRPGSSADERVDQRTP